MRMMDSRQKAVAFVILTIWAILCLGSSSARTWQAQKNSRLSNWAPTHDTSGIRYVGSGTCAQCHKYEASTQLFTPMAHALARAADCEILSTHARLTFRNGPYSYQITKQANRSIYTVSDGVRTISEPILYCFGNGEAGKTYVFQHNGSFYESRLSYYRDVGNLDITILHSRSVPTSVEDALGRPMGQEAARGCFGCHSTAAVSGSQLRLDQLIPGVTCEACHGPGERHVAAVKANKFEELQIFNPGNLDAFDLTQEFCGSCHQSFETVMLMPGQGGINNIRFQPYRIFNSRAHFTNDPRLSCVACHNPHENSRRDAAFYDSRCFACHLSSSTELKTQTRAARSCPVSRKQCVTCHMPKVELPEMHYKFTDHWIRIARSNDPVPR